MVGAALAVGAGSMALEELRELLDSPDPGAPLTTAEARGLTLERVYYRRASKLAVDDRSRPSSSVGTLW
jgi:tRNA U38,U39,U40 pseudouridine synthase TruA